MRIFYTLMLVLSCTIFIQAQSVWNGSVSSDWTDANNWTMGLPVFGGTATIPSGLAVYPVISSPISVGYDIDNFGTITNNSTISTNGTINNNGTIINDGGLIQSTGTGFIYNGATGVFSNTSGSTISNFASIVNDGTVSNSGTIQNFVTVDNNAILLNIAGSLLTNNPGAVINNNADATIENAGAIDNNTLLNNYGTINNVTGGFFNNNSVGTINNFGTIFNEAYFVNNNLIVNTGTITNALNFDNDGTIENDGAIENLACAIFKHIETSSIDGNFVNNGTLYILNGGPVNITAGNGIVLNTLNDFPLPTASCQDATIYLDAAGNATIAVADIDAGSSADYCGIESIVASQTTFDCSHIGANTVQLTITDLAGFTAACFATVTVIDNTAPIVNCQGDIAITLNPGECDVVVNYDIPTASDNCGATVTQTDNTGLTAGDVFPIGTTTLIYSITDVAGNSSLCEIDVTVNPFADPTSTLVCNDNINVSLDHTCTAIITAETVLEGGPYGCYDDYIVNIDGTGSNTINGDYIGQTVEYVVTDPNGFTCWGELHIEDKVAPQIICQDVTIHCNGDSDPSVIGFPIGADNCGIIDYDYTDNYIELDCQDYIGLTATAKIERSWVITDDQGYAASCVQDIYFIKPAITDIALPGNLDNISNSALDCNDDASNLTLTGQPTFNGQALEDGDLCGIGVTSTDQVLNDCGGGSKIFRNWALVDWCTGEIVNHIQIIKLLDTTAPTIACPADVTVSTGQNSCTGSAILNAATISDDCSAITVEIQTPLGTINGNGGVLADAPVGVHTITYIATDACNNATSCTMTVTVVDDIAPVAVCDEHTIVALGIDGTAKVYAETFNDESYDNCGDVTIEVRRMDAAACIGEDGTAFGESVPFYCCDIDNTVLVELQVTDANGLTNSCMVEVEVQDKIDPVIICPTDITLNCDQDYTDLAITGNADAVDNCQGVIVTYVDVNESFNNCHVGSLTRIWTATDAVGLTATCSQLITVTNNDPFDGNTDIVWPLDFDSEECGISVSPDDLPAAYGNPVITEDGCDIVVVTYNDELLPFEYPACYKILRKWTVVDWCQFNADTGEGQWEKIQVIKISNTIAPVITSTCEDFDVCSYDANCGGVEVALTLDATDDCTDNANLRYSYVVDAYTNGTTDTYGSTNDATNTYPIGTHSIVWTVEDGCGNTTTCEYSFTVTDCKKPSPVCINGLSVDLMATTGTVSLWASDFDSGSSFDNCTNRDDLIFSFSSDVNDQVKEFTCADLGTNTIEFWATDLEGNQDYCTTYIIIQDFNNACVDGEARIAGNIENELGEEVEEVTINVNGNTALPFITGNDGSYAFPNLPMHDNYTVAPEKNMNPLNGVSTFDAVLIAKHILGVESIDSPYKVIAADINNSGSVTTFDIVHIRRLILGIDTDFQSNTSWRFVDKNFVFANPANPFATSFPEVISINDLSQDELNANFVAIKVGDLNDTAIPNNLLGIETRTTVGDLTFNVADQALKAGETYTVDFDGQDAVLGYQFTLAFDKETLEFVDIANGATDNFGLTRLGEGVITTSWNDTKALTTGFSLTFKALADIQLSEALKINSRYTNAEAYTENAELLDVALAFNTENGTTIVSTDFELYQNAPNPFKTATTISFNLPEASAATLRIYDVSGKTLRLIDGDFEKGYNEVQLDKGDLPSTGILYYQLDTDTHSSTKKMLLIK